MATKRRSPGRAPAPAKESPALDPQTQQPERFPVVGIGASAGGLEALEEFFRNVPGTSGMAFVVVTHIHPDRPTMLPELLSKHTPMPVEPVADNTRLQPNHVYLNPPGHMLSLFHGVIHHVDAVRGHPPLLIDTFFRSLARDQRQHAVAIVLSGSGTDGTVGVRAVKEESGFVIVQDPGTARYTGMPSSALATGVADLVLAPADMAEKLVAYATGALAALPARERRGAPLPDDVLQKIMLRVRDRTGHDFSSYRQSTLRRRIERRMTVHQIRDAADYLPYLQENPDEIDLLSKEFLINVTSFFRDREVFDLLSDTVIPSLIKQRSAGESIRIWVPGCATGEEAYSLAITIRECSSRLEASRDIQIFATDLNGDAIQVARNGTYPAGIASDVPPPLLERYFRRDDSGFQIVKEIRERIIFAQHDVLVDAPFTKLDLLSCRNLLIYLETHQQQRLLPLLHYALKPGGILVLGPSETIGSLGNLFEAVNPRWRIFRRRTMAVAPHAMPAFPTSRRRLAGVVTPETPLAQGRPSPTTLERYLLLQFAPPSVIVTQAGDIVYIHGRTGPFLEPAAGQPRLNVVEMARSGLSAALSGALREVARADDGEPVRRRVRMKGDSGERVVDMVVQPIVEPAPIRGLILVAFVIPPNEDHDMRETVAVPASASGELDRADDLERELQYTRETLQSAIEELETSNEELTSTNEELQSTNEELQSANEELETSREEAQSLNEELTTVNAELQRKVEELSRINDDMHNLLNATDVATVFLDNDLNIIRFTPRAQELIRLIDTDVGRPLDDLASQLDYDALTADCRKVLRELTRTERTLRTRDGGWWLMRIMPYRTSENVISGLVITFVDINRLKGVIERS